MDSQIAVRAPRAVSRGFDPDILIGDWAAHMRELVAAGEMALATSSTYQRGMGKFMSWFATQHEYKTIGPRAIRSWKADMLRAGRRPSGVNTHLAGVKGFFRWAVADQRLAYNPTLDVKGAKVRGKRHKRDALTDAEVLRLLEQPDGSTAFGKRDRAILFLMAYTGLRTIEVHRARIGDLHTNGQLTLAIHGKGHVEADDVVYLVNSDLLTALYDWLAVHPRGDALDAPLFCGLGRRNTGKTLALRTLRSIIKGHYRAAGIRDPRKTAHSLRHTMVTNLIRHGVAPTKIMTVTRHRSLDTLIAYAHEVARDSDPAERYVDYGEND